MPGSVSVFCAVQTPGFIIESKPKVTSTFSFDSFICYCYMGPATPLNLPVTASSQTFFTQNLLLMIKSLWMIRILLWLFDISYLPVSLRQDELSVSCVWIQCEITGI